MTGAPSRSSAAGPGRPPGPADPAPVDPTADTRPSRTGSSEPFRALVVTVSDRASRGEYADRSGPVLVAGLREVRPVLSVDGPLVVPDGPAVGTALREAGRAGYDLVLTTGGTGIADTDRTPEETAPLLTRGLPGVAEALRAHGVAHGVATAMLSRGLAGLADRMLIVNLPGSTGGCRDGLAVLGPVLGHLLDQVRGGDHG